MHQKVFVLDVNDSREVFRLNQFLENGWDIKFVSEQRVASGGQSMTVYGKIVYVLETKE